MGSYDPFPASPPTSPPNGLDGQYDGYSTPLFAQQPNILFIMADQLAAPLLKMHNPKSQIKTPILTSWQNAQWFSTRPTATPHCVPHHGCVS